MDQSTFTVVVKNPGAVATDPKADTAALYAGEMNTLVISFTASEAVSLDPGAPLVLDFNRFAAGAAPVAKASLDGVTLVTANRQTALPAHGTPDPNGRSFPVALTATLDAGDAVAITLSGVTVSAPGARGRNPNFKGRWSDADGDYAFAADIAVYPPPQQDGKDLPLEASWGLQDGRVAVSANQSTFDNTLDLFITNEGAEAIALTGASFRISAPTVKDDSDPARFDALCTEQEIEAARAAPLTDMRSAWEVANSGKVDEDLAWTLAPTSDANSPALAPKASVGVRISGLVTTLDSADDFKIVVGIDCAVPGYAARTLQLTATKVKALLTAVCDTDATGATWSGAPVLLKWQTAFERLTLTGQIGGKTTVESLAVNQPPSGSYADSPKQDTAYSLIADQSHSWQTTVPVGTVAVSLGIEGTRDTTVKTAMPGSPVPLTYDVAMAGGYTLSPDVITQGAGACHAAGQVVVHPLKTTTFTLTASGFDPDANPVLTSKSASVTVTVPAIGASGVLRYGAIGGIWDLDLSAGTLTRRAEIPEGAIVSDSGMFTRPDSANQLVFWWGYANRPHLYYLDAEGNALLGQTTPDGVHLVTVAGEEPTWGYGPAPTPLLSNARLGPVHDGLPPPGTIRARSKLEWYPAGSGSITRLYAATNGIAGHLFCTDAMPGYWCDTLIPCRPAAMEIDDGRYPDYVYWIDAEQHGLYCDQMDLHGPGPKNPQQPPNPRRLCDARLAGGCWGLAIHERFAYWFEDVPDAPDAVFLCRCHIANDLSSGSRAVILRLPAPHRPAGGGLKCL